MWQTIKSFFSTLFSVLAEAQRRQNEADAETGRELEKQVEDEADAK